MRDRERVRHDGRVVLALVLLAGLAAIGIATAAGFVDGLLNVVATPPRVVRAGLAGFAIVLGGWQLLAATHRIDTSLQADLPADAGARDADLGALVRAVRLVFLSAASFTAAAGWILGDPLPLVIALVIAGVDIVETSFLLLVATRRSR
jgi:hypothetical protein